MVESPSRGGRFRLRRPRLSPTLAGVLAVLRLLPRISPGLTVLLAAVVLASSLLPLGITITAGLLVGSVPPAVGAGLESAAGQRTLTLLGIAALLIVVERLLTPFGASLAAVFGRRVDRYLQEQTMRAVSRPTGISHLEDPAILDLIDAARGVGRDGLRPGNAVEALASLIPSWAQALGSAAILLSFRWWLGLLWLALWPLLLFYLQREYLHVGEVRYSQATVLRRADYYRDLALKPAAAKEVRVWGMAGWLTERYDTAWQRAMQPVWRTRQPGRAVLWLPTVAIVGINLLSFGLLAWAGAQGELALGALAIYIQATLAAGGLRAFDDANMILSNAAVAVPRVLDLQARLGGEGSTARTRANKRLPDDAPRDAIRFESVAFSYPGQQQAVLSGLDLAIPAGRSLAIVGVNGAGKTTLIKLLCRLYEPAAGRIAVDGVDLSELDPRAWRERVTAIFQDFARYHLPARDNIAVGGAREDLHSLRAAAGKAGALELIESLPRGWDTVLSREYAGGVDLSGGQWQRIALARALYAVENGARVLILDEPTANLDVRAEAELYDRFLDITHGLTTILISHRFSTVRRADRIVVLDGGRLVESGTHDELMAAGGRYATMFRVQAERFEG